MNIIEAQNDMRQSYYGGATGVLASGLIWFTTGIIALWSTQQISAFFFFFGGMLIYPLGILFSKLLKRSGKHKKDNPLTKFAIGSTFLLFIGLFLAFVNLENHSEWFFPIMLVAIGVRYMIFSPIYGMRIYLGLGIALTLAGIACYYFEPPFYVGALLGGVLELLFSMLIFYIEKPRS